MVSFNLTIVLFGVKTEAKYRDVAPLTNSGVMIKTHLSLSLEIFHFNFHNIKRPRVLLLPLDGIYVIRRVPPEFLYNIKKYPTQTVLDACVAVNI